MVVELFAVHMEVGADDALCGHVVVSLTHIFKWIR